MKKTILSLCLITLCSCVNKKEQLVDMLRSTKGSMESYKIISDNYLSEWNKTGSVGDSNWVGFSKYFGEYRLSKKTCDSIEMELRKY